MTVTNFSKAKSIPSSKLSTKKSNPTTTNFAAGIYTYKPNDTMDYDEIYLAQNARFDRIGEYATRLGMRKLCEPIGKNTVINTYSMNYALVPAESVEYVITDTSPIYSINLTVAATNDTDYGVVQVSLVDEDDNVVAISCAQEVETTEADYEFIFKDSPSAASGALTVKIGSQFGSKQKYQVAKVTSGLMIKVNTATPGKVTSMFEANIDGTITTLFVFQPKATGAAPTLYRTDRHGNNVYAIRQLPVGAGTVRFAQNLNKIRYADGAEGPRIIDPSNNWSDTAIATVDLKTGVDLNIKVSNIMAGTEDNMMYFDAETNTQAVWTYPYGFSYAPEAAFTTSSTLNAYVAGSTTTTTIDKSTLTAVSETHLVSALAVGDLILDNMGNYGTVTTISGNSVVVTSVSHAATSIDSYDKFDRDFRQNFPAIKTGDPLTAMFNLGGVVYMMTRRNKYYMYSQTADVWSQETSSAQHGTFSQESVACDLNYAYYASDDGIYIFDGSSESSITKNTIQNSYDSLPHKENIRLELYGNYLYVFCPNRSDIDPSEAPEVAFVYNTSLKLWESFDTGVTANAVIGRKTPSNRLICGSKYFGQLFLYDKDKDIERAANSYYSDLGAPIKFDLQTAYLHFGTPSQLHRVTKWRPEFSTTYANDYSIKCGYALDFSDEVKYAFSVNLKNNSIVSESYIWDNPPHFGVYVAPTVQPTTTKVYGEFRRIQFRYQLHSAYEPVNMKAVTVSVQTQRLR